MLAFQATSRRMQPVDNNVDDLLNEHWVTLGLPCVYLVIFL
jgi:hypothetical protein